MRRWFVLFALLLVGLSSCSTLNVSTEFPQRTDLPPSLPRLVYSLDLIKLSVEVPVDLEGALQEILDTVNSGDTLPHFRDFPPREHVRARALFKVARGEHPASMYLMTTITANEDIAALQAKLEQRTAFTVREVVNWPDRSTIWLDYHPALTKNDLAKSALTAIDLDRRIVLFDATSRRNMIAP